MISKSVSRNYKSSSRKIFNYFLLRSFMQAYSGEALGHWGLGFKDYCHFTSPIRRYRIWFVIVLRSSYYERKTMLIRLMKFLSWVCILLQKKDAQPMQKGYSKTKSLSLCRNNWSKRITGTITGIKPHVVFVELDEILTEGQFLLQEFTNEIELTMPNDFSFMPRNFLNIFSRGKIKTRTRSD